MYGEEMESRLIKNKARIGVILILAIPWPFIEIWAISFALSGQMLGFLIMTSIVIIFALIVLYAELIFKPKGVQITEEGYLVHYRLKKKNLVQYDHVKGINPVIGYEGSFNRKLWTGHLFYSPNKAVESFFISKSKLEGLYQSPSDYKRIVMTYDLAKILQDDFIQNKRNPVIE